MVLGKPGELWAGSCVGAVGTGLGIVSLALARTLAIEFSGMLAMPVAAALAREDRPAESTCPVTEMQPHL